MRILVPTIVRIVFLASLTDRRIRCAYLLSSSLKTLLLNLFFFQWTKKTLRKLFAMAHNILQLYIFLFPSFIRLVLLQLDCCLNNSLCISPWKYIAWCNFRQGFNEFTSIEIICSSNVHFILKIKWSLAIHSKCMHDKRQNWSTLIWSQIIWGTFT